MTLEKLIQQIKQRKREIKKYLAPLGKGDKEVLAMLKKSKEWQELEAMREDGDVAEEQYKRILIGDYDVIEKPKMRLEGVEMVKIKGDKGEAPKKGIDYYTKEEIEEIKEEITPIKGVDYFDGKPGYTPVKGRDYFDGKAGDTPKIGVDYFDGEKGDKPVHKWEKTKLSFEKPDGEWGESVDLKGEKGDKGDTPKHKWDGSILYFEQSNGEWGRGINLKTSKARLGKTGHLGGGTSSGGISAVTDTSTINLTLENNSLSAVVIPGGISHTGIGDIGTNTHTQIDTHIAATGASVHGLGSISTQNSNAVTITGGTITGITDLVVADGGTGVSTLTGIVVGNGTSAFTAITDSAGLVAQISDETGSGSLVFGTSPTFTTQIITPLIIGGTGTTDDLILQTTSGVGAAGADMHFLVGNNGATEAMTILNNGNVGIGTTSPTNLLSLGGNSARTFWLERHSTANTAGNTLTVQAGGATAAATDKNSGDLILTCGTATGTGFGSVKLQAVTAGATGTADRAPTTHLEVGNSKFALFGGTPAVQQNTIIDADGTLADITTKFNTLLAALEAYGLLKSA